MIPQRTSAFLMANLGSEVSRMISAREKGQWEFVEKSYGRALKILNHINEFSEMKPRHAEIEILAEVLKEFSDKESHPAVRRADLESYFMPFATRVMR